MESFLNDYNNNIGLWIALQNNTVEPLLNKAKEHEKTMNGSKPQIFTRKPLT